MNAGFFNSLDQLTGDIGIIGSKLLAVDGTVYHAGIGFSIGKKPRTTDWWNDASVQKNCPTPYYMFQGLLGSDRRVCEMKQVLAVSSGTKKKEGKSHVTKPCVCRWHVHEDRNVQKSEWSERGYGQQFPHHRFVSSGCR